MVELAHIEGGGEGVLLTLAVVARRYARREELSHVEWIVHALTCNEPNAKLQRVLDSLGFVIEHVPGSGEAYHLVEAVPD